MHNILYSPHGEPLAPPARQPQQLAMAGDDWTSDRDRKAQARAEAAYRKGALKAADKLEAAADALLELMHLALDAGHDDKMGAADQRRTLGADNLELALYLRSVYDKGAR